MKKAFFIFILFIIQLSASSQVKKGLIGVGGGVYSSNNNQIKSGGYYNIELDYNFNNRWSTSIGLIKGNNTVSEKNSSVLVKGIKSTDAFEVQTNFLLKYSLVKKDKIMLQIGTGVGYLISGKNSFIEKSNSLNFDPYITAVSDICFPLVTEIFTPISKNVIIGLRLGGTFNPNIGFGGKFVGLQTKFKF